VGSASSTAVAELFISFLDFYVFLFISDEEGMRVPGDFLLI